MLNKILVIGLHIMLALGLFVVVSCSPQPAAPTATTAPKAAPAASPTTAPKPAAPAASPSAPAKAATPAAAAPATPVKLKVGTLRILADAGMYIAQEKGYYKEQGIEIEFVNFSTGSEQIGPMAAGQLDIGVGAVNAGLFNAFARGIDMKIVADKGSISPDPKNGFNSSLSLVVRKVDFEAGKYKDLKDLKGKTIAITAEGNQNHIYVDHALKSAGLTLKDVTIKTMGLPDMNVALQNGGIDAAIDIEPLVTIGRSQGILTPWKVGWDIYPSQVVGVTMYGPHMAELGQDVGNRFMLATLKGVREYNDAFGPKKKNRQEIIPMLTANTTMKDAALYDQVQPDWINPDGYVNMETLSADLDWYAANGFVQSKPDLKKVVDNSFVDNALKVLGKYQQ